MNTVDSIQQYLKDGLRGLHQIVADRAKAINKPDDGSLTFSMRGRESLPQEQRGLDEFLLFGRLYLDEFAQVWALDKPIAAGVADVVTIDELRHFLPGAKYSMSPCELAPHDKRCPVCGAMWGLSNASDVVQYAGMRTHLQCARLLEEKTDQEQYHFVIDRTPFAPFPVAYVENGYSSSGIPWVKIKTPWGNIVMGWRRQVINIDWSDTKCDVQDEFESEKVTKGPFGIHAWSFDKAAEYLTKLHARLLLTSTKEAPTT